MLFLLKTNEIMKAKDIAEKLEVNEKQVRRYKEVLDEYFNIESIPGQNGGYRLDKSTYFPFKEVLTQHETILLKQFISGLDSNYIDNNLELMNAIEKINYTIVNKSSDDNLYDLIIPYSRVKAYDLETQKLFDDIYLSILDSKQLIIEYKGNNGQSSERKIEPYQFITYKGEKYLVAFCLLRNEVRFFKLRRIVKTIQTSFTFYKKRNVKDLLDEYRRNSIGIFGGEKYNLTLEIKYPMANTIKERIWVENQIVDDKSYENKIIFKASMTGGPELESWILSMGECVKIIEPIELKEKIHMKLEKMIKNI